MCSIVSLSPRSTSYTFCPLLPLCSLFTFESRHRFSPSCTLLSPGTPNFLCHTPLILPVVPRFFDFLPYFLLVRVSVPFTQLRIHPSSLCSQCFHFFTGIPVPLVVLRSLSFSSAFFFFSFQHSISILYSFPFIHFVLKHCHSLSRFHSQPAPLAVFPHYVTWRSWTLGIE
jgi:hypothetical protein